MGLVTGYMQASELRFQTLEDGTLVVRFTDGDETEPTDAIDVMARAGGWAGSGLGVTVRDQRPIGRDGWTEAVLACNRWNAGLGPARARLEPLESEAEDDVAAQVVVDAWLPLGRVADERVVSDFVGLTMEHGLDFVTSLRAKSR